MPRSFRLLRTRELTSFPPSSSLPFTPFLASQIRPPLPRLRLRPHLPHPPRPRPEDRREPGQGSSGGGCFQGSLSSVVPFIRRGERRVGGCRRSRLSGFSGVQEICVLVLNIFSKKSWESSSEGSSSVSIPTRSSSPLRPSSSKLLLLCPLRCLISISPSPLSVSHSSVLQPPRKLPAGITPVHLKRSHPPLRSNHLTSLPSSGKLSASCSMMPICTLQFD